MDGSEPAKVAVRLQSESVAEVRTRSAPHTIMADEERAVVGVASNLLAGGADSFLVFAVDTWTRSWNATAGEWHILIDVDGDGHPDFVLFSGDRGYWTTGTFDGTVIDLRFDVAKGTATPLFRAAAPTDGGDAARTATARGAADPCRWRTARDG